MPSPGRGRAGWSTSAASAAPSPKPRPSTHAATSSATASPPATSASTRRSGTPDEGGELTSLRIFGVLVVVALLAGAGGASTGLARAAGPTATAIDLGTLGGTSSFAHAVNASGQVVGESFTGAGQIHAFSWTQAGGMVDLGTLGGDVSRATAVTSGRQVDGGGHLPPG